MKVKELITELLEMPMDSEVMLFTPENATTNAAFNIDGVENVEKRRGELVYIKFTDWRDIVGGTQHERP